MDNFFISQFNNETEDSLSNIDGSLPENGNSNKLCP
jgi:hypothetical protein